MRITRLRLTYLKRHAALDIEFAAGLTVIRGPNEAGKSTVQKGIEMALFRRPTSLAQEMDSVKPWAKPDAVPTVELDFESDGVVGSVTKTFAGAKGTARLQLGSEVVTDPTLIEKRLAEVTGLPTEKFFRSTACIRHQELADLDRDEGALRDRLQQSMTGADGGTFAARRKLTEAIARYRAEGPKNPGPLKATRDDIVRLTVDVQRGQTELATLERDRSALAIARADRETLDRHLAEAQTALDLAERAVAARDRLVKSEADYSRYKRASELREQIERLEASHPSTIPLADLRSGVERLRSMEYDISERRAELASQPDPAESLALADRPPQWRIWVVIAVVAVVASGGAVALVSGTAGVAAGGVLALVTVVCLGIAAFRFRGAGSVRAANEARAIEISTRSAGRADLEDGLRDVERQRDHALVTLGMADLAAAEDRLGQETSHAAEIDKAQAEYRGLLGDSPEEWEDVIALRDRSAAVADEARHALAGMGAVGSDPDRQRQRADGELKTVRGDRERAFAQEAAAGARVDSNTVDAEEVAGLEERLDAAKERLASLERRMRVYQLALDSLDAAEQATMKKAARYLEQRMGTDVAAITEGRYRRVQVDENELSFRVFSVEAGDWVAVGELSRGTLDQIYLAARLGLVRQATQDRRPPLIFDDPFVTFDDERARRAVTLLKTVAQDFQVLYLTTSARYDTIADRLIELPRPMARDEEGDADAVSAPADSLWPTASADPT